MNMKISTIIDYISYLLKKYGEIQQAQTKNIYRVASIKKSTNGTKIIIQVIGKSTFMEFSPAEILSNDAFVEQFSRKDIQKISYVYAQDNLEEKEPDLTLIQQKFDIHGGKISFILKDQNGNTSAKTASEIVKDKTIVKNLSKQDAVNIGYIAGYEHSQSDT